MYINVMLDLVVVQNGRSDVTWVKSRIIFVTEQSVDYIYDLEIQMRFERN